MEQDFIANLMKMTMPGSSFRLILALSQGENYISELARMTGLDKAHSLNILRELEAKGLITHTRTVGRNKYYKLNLNFAKMEENKNE